MIRHFIEVGFRSEQAKQHLEGVPQKRDVFVQLFCQYVALDNENVNVSLLVAIDRRPCQKLAVELKAQYIDRFVSMAQNPFDAGIKIVSGLLEIKKFLQGRPFLLPDFHYTLQELDASILATMVRS